MENYSACTGCGGVEVRVEKEEEQDNYMGN